MVIDTSVAVKWFLPEPGHDTAVALLATESAFQAPDLVFTEFASAMQKKIRLGEADRSLAAESCAALPELFESISPTLVLFQRALEIAVAMSHPVQDCIFLACAEQAGSCVVTADRKLIEKATERGFGHLPLGMNEAVSAARRNGMTVAISPDVRDDLLRLGGPIDAALKDLGTLRAAPTERFVFVPAAILARAIDAPAHRRLEALIAALPIQSVRDLVALCWLGRAYDGHDWPELRDRAERAIDPTDLTYVLSLIAYLPAGIERVRGACSSSDMHRDA